MRRVARTGYHRFGLHSPRCHTTELRRRRLEAGGRAGGGGGGARAGQGRVRLRPRARVHARLRACLSAHRQSAHLNRPAETAHAERPFTRASPHRLSLPAEEWGRASGSESRRVFALYAVGLSFAGLSAPGLLPSPESNRISTFGRPTRPSEMEVAQ